MKFYCKYCGKEYLDGDDEYLQNNQEAAEDWLYEKYRLHLDGDGVYPGECTGYKEARDV